MKLKIDKHLILEDGAFDKAMRAKIKYTANNNAATDRTFETNMGQYFFNPMVWGPLDYISGNVKENLQRGIYKLTKDKNSADAPEADIKFKEGVNQPWNLMRDTEIKTEKDYANDLDNIKADHSVQYYTNPLIPGSVQHSIATSLGASAESARSKYSPFTKVGSTLKWN